MYIITFLRFFYSLLEGGEICVVCGKKSYLIPLCRDCKKIFDVRHALLKQRCRFCGKELVSEAEVCMECRHNQIIKSADKVFPLFSYRLWNKELLFLWKIQGVRSLSSFFAKLIWEALRELQIEYIVPVPPRPGKIQSKGWDQIEEICLILKNFYGLKVLKLLERKSLLQQKKLNRVERLSKIESAYVYSFKGDVVLPDKVCIIDDVCTTGATLEICSSLIKKQANISEIYALTIFSVD